MRQVTGSNSTTSEGKVPIQLRLGGHSFSRDILPREVADNAVVEVELLTEKSTLVPTECFSPESAEQLLWLAGFPCTSDERAVFSSERDGRIAVMAVNREVADELENLYDSRLEYTSPLLHDVAVEGRYLYIYNAGNVAYFKLGKGRELHLCEAVAVAGNEDVLYVVARLVQEFGLVDFEVYVAGEDHASLVKLLKQYYKVGKCE